MAIGIILLIGALGANIATMPPRMYTPQQVAEWSHCKPSKIAYAISQNIEYRLQGPQWDDAYECLVRGWGDCKCLSITAKEALNRCAGYEARMVVVQRNGQHHAIAVYVLPDGRRGFINGQFQRNYPPGTEWAEVARNIDGGKEWQYGYDHR